LAGYFGTNKAVIEKLQQKQVAVQAVATQDQLIAAAGAAANAAHSTITA
jgi:hypothetical protein